MLSWDLTVYIVSIYGIIHCVQSQVEDKNSTKPRLSTTINEVKEQSIERVSSTIPSYIITDSIGNRSQQNMNQIYLNESLKQRIIIALAVLCAALVVLLGFLFFIIVCQRIQRDKDEDDLPNGPNQSRINLAGSSNNYQNHSYRQTMKL
ncbi:unnamed protein product [Rotaria socialis]|uniref:Uncharacterized protein n=1 Tax=Rotaria socialis TaxID=392032 RepID=A0A820K3B9_9BILA|nr:unnamed protein product [Rotaria socialis]CAF3303026.1 unnamed protein product [Rotaria socialis]CAF3606214.1 unnamed protein product [Rotaria socialis]CAF3696409.1 unnamed protein product [Rotaria socialis]CAF3766383.1 unnamed protein product [Rotaria socialis]